MSICRKCHSECEIPPNRIARSDYRCRLCVNKDMADFRQRKGFYHQNLTAEERKVLNRKAYLRRSANPVQLEKMRLRRRLHYAIKAGKIIRQPCEVCGEARVDAHHDDYSKPFDVRWLCRPHHVQFHRNEART